MPEWGHSGLLVKLSLALNSLQQPASSRIPEKEAYKLDRSPPQTLPPSLNAWHCSSFQSSGLKLTTKLEKVHTPPPSPSNISSFTHCHGESRRGGDSTRPQLLSLPFEDLPMPGRAPVGQLHVPRGHGAGFG